MKERIDSDILRLKDILNAIQDARNFAAGGLENRALVFAVAYAIAIIGEAATHLSKELLASNTHIPWQDIIRMRHKIIHGYGKVDVDALSDVVKRHLPVLQEHITAILRNSESNSTS